MALLVLPQGPILRDRSLRLIGVPFRENCIEMHRLVYTRLRFCLVFTTTFLCILICFTIQKCDID